jgi:ferredoxin--NADP+ reductase
MDQKSPVAPKVQDFLEANPYYDMSNIPLQLFKAKEPYVGKIISVKRIVGAQATGETCNIVIDHQGKVPYWEGQSYGIIPPGNIICSQHMR